jgi:hypothetical protein
MLYWGCIHCGLGYRWFLALPFELMTVLSFFFFYWVQSLYFPSRVCWGKNREDFLRDGVAL